MYKAITSFIDLQDNSYKYHAGDAFPREGMEVSEERIEELLTDKNRRHKPMIEEIKEEVSGKEEIKKPTSKKGGRKKADAE